MAVLTALGWTPPLLAQTYISAPVGSPVRVSVPTSGGPADFGPALSGLESWLASDSSHGPGWVEFLDLRTIRGEYDRTGTVSRETLEAARTKLDAGEAGLDRPLFRRLRMAIDARLTAQPGSLARLADQIDAAKSQLRPITSEEVATKKAILVNALVAADRALQQGPVAYQAGWKEYLLWTEFANTLASETPDLAILQRTDNRLSSGVEGLEWLPLRTLRRALKDYGAVYYYQAGPADEARERFDREVTGRLDRLKTLLQTADTDPTDVRLAEIGRTLGFLESLGQLPNLVSQIRAAYARPNLYASVSERFINRLVGQPVTDVRPVHEVILGTDIYGTAYTNAYVSADLKPAVGAASLVLRLNGTVMTQNVGFNRGVQINNVGRTAIAAEKPVTVSFGGIVAGPACANANTSTTITGIRAKLRIIERIAEKRIAQQKSEAEQIASQRAAERVRLQFEERANPQLAQANTQLRQALGRLDVLHRRDLYPKDLSLSSSETDVLFSARTQDANQLAASSGPPVFASAGDVRLTLHESAVGNISEAFLSGQTISTAELDDRLDTSGDTGGIVITPSQAAIDRENRLQDGNGGEAREDELTITFAEVRPVAVNFRGDGTIRVLMRVSQLRREATTIRRAIEIATVYRVLSGGGSVSLERVGGVDVQYPGRDRLSAGEVTVRGILARRLDEILPARVDGISLSNVQSLIARRRSEQGLPPLSAAAGGLGGLGGGASSQVGNLMIERLDLSEGWAAISLSAR